VAQYREVDLQLFILTILADIYLSSFYCFE